MTVQLLGEGNVSSVTDVRWRASIREAIRTSVGAQAMTGSEATQHDSLRALLETGLFDEEMRAQLEEVFTRFNRTEDAAASDEEETVDAQELYEEFQKTFEEFHASLKRIFRLVEDVESEEAWPTLEDDEAASASPDAASEASASEQSGDTAAEKASKAQEELIERITEAVRSEIEKAQAEDDVAAANDAPSAGEPEDADDTDDSYARLASAYEAHYDMLSDEERPLFSTEG